MKTSSCPCPQTVCHSGTTKRDMECASTFRDDYENHVETHTSPFKVSERRRNGNDRYEESNFIKFCS